MRNRFTDLAALVAVVVALAGCSSPAPVGRPLEDVYDSVNRRGSRDAVEVLREGMRTRRQYGTTDPYTPLRTPEEVIPVWVPAYVDPRTGRRVDGHWEHSVIRRSTWETS
jgi:hypothetical protein